MLRRVFILAVALPAACTSAPPRRTEATVVSIVPKVSRLKAAALTITARSADGLVGAVDVDTRELECRVGDTVDAEVRGVALRLRTSTCRRSAMIR